MIDETSKSETGGAAFVITYLYPLVALLVISDVIGGFLRFDRRQHYRPVFQNGSL